MAGWYKTGTIDVANGGTTVTGHGVVWTGVVFAGDTFTQDDDHFYEVASLTDSTHLELDPAVPFGEATVTGGIYRILPTSPLRNSTTTLVQQFAQIVDAYGQVVLIAGSDRLVQLGKTADAANAGTVLLSASLYKFRAGLFGNNDYVIQRSPAGLNTDWEECLAFDATTGSVRGQILMSGTQALINVAATVPPGSPAVGDQYFVAPAGSGAWSALIGKIVRWNGTTWTGYIPQTGQIVYNTTNGKYYSFVGGVFVVSLASNTVVLPSLGGTGVANNDAYTVTLGGSVSFAGAVTTTGAFSLDLTLTANTAVTMPTSGILATRAGAETFLNKTVDASLNTLSNITLAMFASGVVDTDPTLAANSNTKIATQAAVLSLVSNAITGIWWKPAVQAATTANITLSGTQTVDNVVLVVGNRVLVKNQTTASQNGIYVVAAGAWTRAIDADVAAELWGATVYVEVAVLSNTNGGTQWVNSNTSLPTVGTTDITFSQISGAGTYTATGGVTLTGNQFSITPNGITYAMIQTVAAASLVGNPTGGAATAQGITLGATLQFSSAVLQTKAMTGDVTATANSFATTVAAIQGTTVSGTTGTGNVAFSNSPTFVTPTLGAASATSISVGGITLGAFSSTFTVASDASFTRNINGNAIVLLTNSNTGTTSQGDFRISNGTSLGIVRLYGTGFTTASPQRADGMLIAATGAGGLTLETTSNQPLYFVVNGAEVCRITTAGLNGGGGGFPSLGTISGTYRIDLSGNATRSFRLLNSADSLEGITVLNVGAGNGDTSSSTPHVSLTGSGYAGVHFLNSTGYTIWQNSGARSIRVASGSSATVGVELLPSATSWSTVSERAKKTDFSPIEDALGIINAHKLELGRYKTDDALRRLRPFIFYEDAIDFWPYAAAVSPEGNGTVSLTEYIPLIMQGVKDIIVVNDNHETRISALEKELADLRKAA